MKMKKQLLRFFQTILCITVFFSCSQTIPQYYDFQNVTIGGGGYVTGLVFHPAEENLLYVRTDVGGAYRWNPVLGEWKQLMLSVPQLGSVDGFAIAETNPNLLFMACGNSRADNPLAFDILKSTDRGETWQKLGFNQIGIERAFEGNQRDVRYIGERIAVDPANENIVFVGTKEDGLWKSTNGGSSWSKVNSIPNTTIRTTINHDKNPNVGFVGVRNILFDKSSVSGGRTQIIYVGNYEDGLYKSTDGGNTFSRISGSPETIRRMDITPDGSTLWVTTGYPIGGKWGDGGKVYKYRNGLWQDQNLTPVRDNEPMGALTIHPSDPDKIIVTSGRNQSEQKIYRTDNGGQSWHLIHHSNGTKNKIGQVWWHEWFFATGPATIAFNPFNTNEVWFPSGEGVWRTDNIWVDAPLWVAEVDKLEELVGFVVKAPSSGSAVFFGCADADGFRITDVNKPPQSRFAIPNLTETTDISIVENNPDHMVRVGGFSWGRSGTGGYSTDNGKSWTEFSSWPNNLPNGKVAVSATSLDKIVVLPLNSKPYYSTDRGASWKISTIAEDSIVGQIWQYDKNLEADKVNGNIFYIYNRENGTFYRSENGGQSFNHVNNLPTSGWGEWVYVRTMPGIEKEVWVSSYDGGLRKSGDGGNTFTLIPGVELVEAFDFGANSPGKNNASLYLAGQVNGVKGVFVSDDLGVTFTKINKDSEKFADGLKINDLAASRHEYGRIYMAQDGWGFWYGALQTAESEF